MATLQKALTDKKLLFMDGGQALEPVDDGYKIIQPESSGVILFCSPNNRNRAISPDGKYLFIPTTTTQKEKA